MLIGCINWSYFEVVTILVIVSIGSSKRFLRSNPLNTEVEHRYSWPPRRVSRLRTKMGTFCKVQLRDVAQKAEVELPGDQKPKYKMAWQKQNTPTNLEVFEVWKMEKKKTFRVSDVCIPWLYELTILRLLSLSLSLFFVCKICFWWSLVQKVRRQFCGSWRRDESSLLFDQLGHQIRMGSSWRIWVWHPANVGEQNMFSLRENKNRR